MNTLAQHIGVNSKLIIDNELIEGSEEVAKFLLRACEAYNAGYMNTYRKLILQRNIKRGVIAGLVIGGVYLGNKYMHEHRISKK